MQDIEMDFIAKQGNLNVNIATKLDTSPIAASRNRGITTTKENMKRRIFMASPKLEKMTTMGMHQMIEMKVIPPKLLHQARRHSSFD